MSSTCFIFLWVLVCQTALSQAKKEQIETLILQKKDSYIKVLYTER